MEKYSNLRQFKEFLHDQLCGAMPVLRVERINTHRRVGHGAAESERTGWTLWGTGELRCEQHWGLEQGLTKQG
jgi:hypothetical protein